ncbi:MAG TPA: hypothetical protein VJY62_14720 [Bacteroidia bacterium]|nr:hypothetical protein [Bacteroidia bacterium]
MNKPFSSGKEYNFKIFGECYKTMGENAINNCCLTGVTLTRYVRNTKKRM